MPRGGKRPGAGRPKGSQSVDTRKHKKTLMQLAQEHTEDALMALIDIAKNGKTESGRISAASALLDRGYGKPPQTIDMTVKDETRTDAELLEELAKLRAKRDPAAVATPQADRPH